MGARLSGGLPTGLALLAGGGGALYLSGSFPPETRTAARAAGVAAAVAGAWLVYRELSTGGGVLGAARDLVLGVEPELVESDVLTVDDLRESNASTAATPDAGKPFVIPWGGEVLSPARGGSVTPAGVLSSKRGTYPMAVSLYNATASAITAPMLVRVFETYGLGGDESASVSEVVTVEARSERVLTLNVPVGGGSVRYSNASADVELVWNGRVLDTLSFQIKAG